MKNVNGLLLKAWFERLNGNVSLPVYRKSVPATEQGDYILLSIESDSSEESNNQEFVTNPVIISEVVTHFRAAIDDQIAIDADNEIGVLVKPTSAKHALPAQEGIQIVDLRRSSATYIDEDDGEHLIHRLITRNLHRVVQLVNES